MASKKKIIGSGVDVQTAAGVSALTVDETTGAVTVGPSSFTQNTKHQLNGQLATKIGSEVSVSTSPTNVLDFAVLPSGIYLVSVVREGGSVGTNGVFIVGNSDGITATIYHTIGVAGLTGSTSGSFFRVALTTGTQNIYTNALMLVGGS